LRDKAVARSLLVLSGGHPYEDGPFSQLLAALGDWQITHLIQPEAEEAVAAGAAADADAVLFYDMPGYTFSEGRVETRAPSPAFREALTTRFANGRGAVAMHHALAGWAEWPEWHAMLGGRFLYQPGEVRGAHQPDSGYCHDVSYTARLVADHPVLAGVPESFAFTDELYLAQVFEDAITPLIRAEGFAFTADNFYSAANAVAGAMFSREGWQHPPGSNCVAWVKQIGLAPLVYLQFGDGPDTYANPHFRRILANAVNFIAGEPGP
jgi:type 1 glutamine amidotransferase